MSLLLPLFTVFIVSELSVVYTAGSSTGGVLALLSRSSDGSTSCSLVTSLERAVVTSSSGCSGVLETGWISSTVMGTETSVEGLTGAGGGDVSGESGVLLSC